MKKQFLILILSIVFNISFGQTICVQCFNQNNPVSGNINNRIVNGGFEISPCITHSFCPISTWYDSNCDITGWTCTGGGSDTYAQVFDSANQAWYGSFLSEIIEGNYAVYMGNSFGSGCPAGNNACLVDSGCAVIGLSPGYPVNSPNYGGTTGVSIEQTVSGLTPGNGYALEFWAGGEYDAGQQDGLFAVDVGFGKIFLRDKMTDIGTIGTRYLIEFIATSSTHTIKFTNWGHFSSTTEVVLDDIRFYSIGELPYTVPNCILGISENNNSNKAVISNYIFSDELYFESGIEKPTDLSLYDMTGRKIFQKIFTNAISLNSSSIIDGMYLYKLTDERGILKKGSILRQQ